MPAGQATSLAVLQSEQACNVVAGDEAYNRERPEAQGQDGPSGSPVPPGQEEPRSLRVHEHVEIVDYGQGVQARSANKKPSDAVARCPAHHLLMAAGPAKQNEYMCDSCGDDISWGCRFAYCRECDCARCQHCLLIGSGGYKRWWRRVGDIHRNLSNIQLGDKCMDTLPGNPPGAASTYDPFTEAQGDDATDDPDSESETSGASFLDEHWW